MFTSEQIKMAHGKVKSGADFPAYIQEIKSLGITNYVVYVTDGHAVYANEDSHAVTIDAKYPDKSIALQPSIEHFRAELRAHQQGQTDYMTFISMCADTGIEKWIIDLKKMTCTYFDMAGNIVLTEQIPT